MKRAAFTLMEVMISVLLLTFLGWGVLQMQAQSLHNAKILEDQLNMAFIASPMLIENNPNDHGKSKNLYDFLKTRYKIDYDPLIDSLKKRKLTFRQDEYGFIEVDPTQNIGITLYKNSLRSETNGATTFSFGLNR